MLYFAVLIEDAPADDNGPIEARHMTDAADTPEVAAARLYADTDCEEYADLAGDVVIYEAADEEAIYSGPRRRVHANIDEVEQIYTGWLDDRDEERREWAMQQRMAFGCDGYNEAMGY